MLPPTPTLYLDAATPRLWVGLRVAAGEHAVWTQLEVEAGVGLLQIADEFLNRAGLRVDDLASAVFCEGPGSMLGIRLVAMSLRTWSVLPRARPLACFAYRSLDLVARDLLNGGEPPPFTVLSDARRTMWNLLEIEAGGALRPLRRSAADEPLPTGRLFTADSFPHWQPLPPNVRTVPYRPELIADLDRFGPLLRPCGLPDAFMLEAPTYRTWNPEPVSKSARNP